VAIAGTLTVNVLARTLGFNKSIGSARKGLRGFNKEVVGTNALMGRLKGAFAGVLGGLTLRAGFNFLRNQAEMASALKKTAQTLDLTTEELGLFQFAAKTAGVESRQLNISIQRMSRRIGEAALGGGELAKTLFRLGIDAKALSKLSVGDQFLAMGEALSKITNQDEQLAAIFKTFDSEGVPVFRVFGDNLDRARRLYERFNLALDSTDARKLDELATQASILKEAFGAAGRNFLVDISPDVLKALDFLQNIVSKREPGEKRLGESAFERVVREKRELEGKPSGIDIFFDRSFAKRFGKTFTNVVKHELLTGQALGPVFKDPRKLPFGPAPGGAQAPGISGLGVQLFNQAVISKPIEEIRDLLNQIAGNTEQSAAVTGGGSF